MQKKAKQFVAFCVPGLLLAANLSASLTTTLDVPPAGYRDTNGVGGEFTAVVSGGNNFVQNYNPQATAQITVNGNNVTGFETFCVEMTAEFNPGSSYNTIIGNSIVSGPGSSTYLTVGAAYLYSQFAQGILSGYNYNPNSSGVGSRAYTADELQDAIWYLQGEINSGTMGYVSDSLYTFNSSTDPFVTLVQGLFGSNDTASDAGNNYGVSVLNLTSTDSNGNTVYNQDQMVYGPVPEPATFTAGAMLLLPLGLSAARALRRKG